MKLLCDSMLGKLAVYLRTLGIDTEYSDSRYFDLKTDRVRGEERIFLTRDTRVLKMKNVPPYFFVKSNYPDMQLPEVLEGLKIELQEFRPFSRCLRCNCELRIIEKEDIRDKVPDYVYKTQKSFSFCERCNSVYWQGTHYERIRRWVDTVRQIMSR